MLLSPPAQVLQSTLTQVFQALQLKWGGEGGIKTKQKPKQTKINKTNSNHTHTHKKTEQKKPL